MKIAICDDEASCRAQIYDLLCDYVEDRKDKEIQVELFTSPEALLRTVQEGSIFDIVILDIVMPGMNGIQLGQALRNESIDQKIVYLTSSEEYALDSFRVRAFDYLLKPVEKKTLFPVLDEAISSIHIKKDKSLIIKTKETNARVTFDSILYAELAKRAIVYHLIGGKTVESTTLRTTFSEAMQELLTDRRFLLCGTSTLVNLHHITMVENESIVFQDTLRVFLNKKICRELRAAWNNYWIGEEV